MIDLTKYADSELIKHLETFKYFESFINFYFRKDSLEITCYKISPNYSKVLWWFAVAGSNANTSVNLLASDVLTSAQFNECINKLLMSIQEEKTKLEKQEESIKNLKMPWADYINSQKKAHSF